MKVLLIGFATVLALEMTGCGKSQEQIAPSAQSQQQEQSSESKTEISQMNRQELMQESIRIQTDKIMAKKEKATAFEEIQKRNRELMEEEMRKK